MEEIRKNQGITLIALVVTIIVVIILASISLIQGKSLINKAKAENILTNMLTIRGTAKVYAEEIHSQTWGINDDGETRKKIFEEKYYMTDGELTDVQRADLDDSIVVNGIEVYDVTVEALEEIGLDNLKEDSEEAPEYAVVYNATDYTKLDVIYKPGITYEETLYYSLASLQKAMGGND